MSNANEQVTPQPEHQVIADGEIIYAGPEWQKAFLEAGLHATYGTITHVQDGIEGAVLGPPLHQSQQMPS